MGNSVDWLDVYTRHGAESVREAMRAATAPEPPAEPARAGGASAWPPDPELVLPEQAGPRAMVFLRAMFAAVPGDCWQLRRYAGHWYVWVTPRRGLARWVECPEETLRGAVREVAERFWTRKAVAKEGAGTHVDTHGVIWKYARFAPTDRVIDDTLRAVVHRLAVTTETLPTWLAADVDAQGAEVCEFNRWRSDQDVRGPVDPARVISFANGLLDVDAWAEGRVRLLPHCARWFSLSTLDSEAPVDVLAGVDDPDDEGRGAEAWLAEACPSWLEFIAHMSGGDEAWLESLQRFVGYLLTMDTTLDVIGVVCGLPGTGKGTLVEAIEAAIGPDNVARTDLDALASRFGVAPLVGKNLAVISELHVSGMTNVAAALERLKSISGGDAQLVDDKFARVTARVRMSVKFMLTPNEMPRLPDASAALVRRMVMLPTDRAPERPDPTLSDRLQAERAGIRVWALMGLRRLLRAVKAGERPFPECGRGAEAIDEFRRSSSPMLAFVADDCVLGPGNSCVVDYIYERHLAWRKQEGLSEELAKATFGRQLRASVLGLRRVEQVVDGRRVYVYEGIRPTVAEDESNPGITVVARHVRTPWLDDGRGGPAYEVVSISPSPSSDKNA